MNKENCALKLVDEVILYYDARSKNIKLVFICFNIRKIGPNNKEQDFFHRK